MAPKEPKSPNLRYARCGGLVGCVRAGGPDRSREGEGACRCVCARLSAQQAPGTHTHTHHLLWDSPVLSCASPVSDHPPLQSLSSTPAPTPTHLFLISVPLTSQPSILIPSVALTCNYRTSKAHRCKDTQPRQPQPRPVSSDSPESFSCLPHSHTAELCVFMCV